MIKRILTAASIIIPTLFLLLLWQFPQFDPVLSRPIFHFYIVTFFTFSAAVVSFFTMIMLGRNSPPRHRLMITAAAAMGVIFFIHGVTTPNALIMSFNPGVRWAAWLTLFVGGGLFALAALDRPDKPLSLPQLRGIEAGLAILIGAFALIVAFRPTWLTMVEGQLGEWWPQEAIFWLTLLAWIWAAWQLGRTWRRTGDRVDGIMALNAVWLALATISMHRFLIWQLSWWLYHILLLMAAITAVFSLVQQYEQVRRFRLTPYYAATSLIVTAALALLASYLFAQTVQSLAGLEAVVQARLNGLLIAGASMGALFLALLGIVRRADKLIMARTDELAQAYADLQEAEAMRDDLTDMIVHDLRSPLTAIELNLSLLQKTLNDPDKAAFRPRFIEDARGSVQRMLRLINDLLDVARLEGGRLHLSRSPVAIRPLLQEQISLHTARAEAGQKSLRLMAPERLPTPPADSELIGRVLDNLLNNAIKYTGEGGHITLRAQRVDSALLIQVEDDGEGMSPQQARHVFDKFYQVKDDSGKPRRGGTGLGLAFCKLVVEAHHGRIWAESREGEGSTFSFTLPLSPPPQEEG